MTVPISAIVRRKGTDVFTVSPDQTVADALHALAEHNIGALVVSRDGQSVEGILSERDVVRRLAEQGAACLEQTVAQLMTTEVTTCEGSETVDELMATMTENRIRHVPVVREGRLVGLVSIGDVVKSRIDDLETEAHSLEDYITGRA